MVALFGSTLFCSAALVFWVQPMVGRMFLPLLGGKPAVWNTCLLFFQTMLLGGYLIAHWISKRSSLRSQIFCQALLLIGAGLVLPLQISGQTLSSLPSDGDPSFWLFRSLLWSVGPPFIVLCANGPLLQNWFSRSTHSSAKDPYFLYGASNAGSLIALLAGPALLDRKSGLQTQSLLWAAGYTLLLPLLLLCGWMTARIEAKAIPGRTEAAEAIPSSLASPPAAWPQRLRWTALAFVPASLMMAVTSYLSNDIATIPLFWVLPLAIYLLTFILAFARITRLLLRPLARVLPILAIAMVYTFLSEANDPPWLLLLVHLLFLFVAALVLHGRLAQERPPPAALTEFFLCVSFGGACAGIFNALIAPNLFNSVAEYPIGIILACLLAPPITIPHVIRPGRWLDFLVPATLGLLTVALARLVSELPWTALHLRPALVFGLPVITSYIVVDRPLRFALALAAIVLASIFYTPAQGRVLYRARNFFGVSQVTLDRSGNFHRLVHGNTLHGMQSVNLGAGCEPLAYYHRAGPLGQVMATFHRAQTASSIGVIGLGIGSMLSYARADETWTFYEIDPAVVRIARNTNYFTCLQNPPTKNFQIVMGDARLQLARAPNASYGLILLDAFSSDAIPLHLLSQQALDLYLGKLAPNGLLAFHISNRYLNLEPVLATLAQAARLTILARDDSEADLPRGKEESHWVIFARQRSDLGLLLKDARWFPVSAPAGAKPWTDDFSNILSVFRWN